MKFSWFSGFTQLLFHTIVVPYICGSVSIVNSQVSLYHLFLLSCSNNNLVLDPSVIVLVCKSVIVITVWGMEMSMPVV